MTKLLKEKRGNERFPIRFRGSLEPTNSNDNVNLNANNARNNGIIVHNYGDTQETLQDYTKNSQNTDKQGD